MGRANGRGQDGGGGGGGEIGTGWGGSDGVAGRG